MELPLEIWAEIISCCRTSLTPAQLASLCLINKSLKPYAQTALYHTPGILRAKSYVRFLRTVQNDAKLANKVRKLTWGMRHSRPPIPGECTCADCCPDGKKGIFGSLELFETCCGNLESLVVDVSNGDDIPDLDENDLEGFANVKSFELENSKRNQFVFLTGGLATFFAVGEALQHISISASFESTPWEALPECPASLVSLCVQGADIGAADLSALLANSHDTIRVLGVGCNQYLPMQSCIEALKDIAPRVTNLQLNLHLNNVPEGDFMAAWVKAPDLLQYFTNLDVLRLSTSYMPDMNTCPCVNTLQELAIIDYEDGDIYDQVLENLDLARYSKLSTIYSHFLLPTNSPHPLEDEREKTFHDSAAALNIVLKSDDMPDWQRLR